MGLLLTLVGGSTQTHGYELMLGMLWRHIKKPLSYRQPHLMPDSLEPGEIQGFKMSWIAKPKPKPTPIPFDQMDNGSTLVRYPDIVDRELPKAAIAGKSELYMEDIAFSTVPGKEMTAGLMRMGKGPAFSHIYTY